MTKILIEMEKSDATTELARRSLENGLKVHDAQTQFRFDSEIDSEVMNWCDICYAVRPNTPIAVSVAKRIKESGRMYISMFDDDLLNLSGSLPWRKKCTRQCIECSDVVISTSPFIAKEYSALTKTKRYYVSKSPIAESEIKPLHQFDKKIRFVYAAGRDHELFFNKLVVPSLKSILDKYHDRIHFTFVGVEPNVKSLGYPECFDFVGMMPLKQYEQYMWENEFDVGLAPLEDNYFNNRKYYNKFIEYAKNGIIGLFSNCAPFTFIVKDKENGFLLNNTNEEWENTLEYIINNIECLATIPANAQKAIKTELNYDRLSQETVEVIPEILDFHCDKPVIYKKERIKNMMFALADKWAKLTNQFRTRGLRGTYKFIVNYIKDHTRRK